MNEQEVIIRKCCVCGRVHDNGLWLFEPSFIAGLARYSHGYCPSCEAKALAALAEWESNDHNVGVTDWAAA